MTRAELLAQADALEWARVQIIRPFPEDAWDAVNGLVRDINIHAAQCRAQAAALEAQESEPVAARKKGK